MGRRRKTNCCSIRRNFNEYSPCYNTILALKIFIWCCIWIYLLKFHVFNDSSHKRFPTNHSMPTPITAKADMNDTNESIEILRYGILDTIMISLMNLVTLRSICFIAFVTLSVAVALSV